MSVVGRPSHLLHRNAAVQREFEEVRLGRVRRTDGNSVAIADLADAEGIGQVPYGSLGNIAGTPGPLRATISELHGVKGDLR